MIKRDAERFAFWEEVHSSTPVIGSICGGKPELLGPVLPSQEDGLQAYL